MSESQAIWAHFTWFDWAIAGVMILSMLVSIVRGFLREVVSLTAWLVAVWVSFNYSHTLSGLLTGYVESEFMRMVISVGLLFFAALIGGVFINVVVGGFMQRSRLSLADRMLGVVFGATRGLLIVTLVVMVAGMTDLPQSDWWLSSQLTPYFEHSAAWMSGFLPARVVKFVKPEQSGGRPKKAGVKSQQSSQGKLNKRIDQEMEEEVEGALSEGRQAVGQGGKVVRRKGARDPITGVWR